MTNAVPCGVVVEVQMVETGVLTCKASQWNRKRIPKEILPTERIGDISVGICGATGRLNRFDRTEIPCVQIDKRLIKVGSLASHIRNLQNRIFHQFVLHRQIPTLNIWDLRTVRDNESGNCKAV